MRNCNRDRVSFKLQKEKFAKFQDLSVDIVQTWKMRKVHVAKEVAIIKQRARNLQVTCKKWQYYKCAKLYVDF